MIDRLIEFFSQLIFNITIAILQRRTRNQRDRWQRIIKDREYLCYGPWW